MRIEVTLFVAGTVFKEVVIARDYEDAKKTALARNPIVAVGFVPSTLNLTAAVSIDIQA